MDWNQPIAVPIPEGLAPFKRLVALLGHYDTRFYCAPGSFVDVGAGSLPYVENLRLIPPDKGRVGSIGRFCEFNESARVIVHGEHRHDRPVNVSFSALAMMQNFDALYRFLPFEIGSGVVVSAGATILSGGRVGDGAVIGAHALVRKEVPARSIVVGVPAREISKRDPFAPWWDWEVAYLLGHKARLQELASDLRAPHPYRVDRPRFCIKLEGEKLSFEGIADGDQIAPIGNAPQKVQDYVIQALTSPKPYWLADCWA